MPSNPDSYPPFRRRPAKAIQFDPNKPKESWPEGVVEYKPRNYELIHFRLRLPLNPWDWIIHEGTQVLVMDDSQFQLMFEAHVEPTPFRRTK